MFKDYLLITDLDGTLLNSKKQISKGNQEAIKKFINGGGIFTIATGRGYEMTLPVMEMLETNAPAVIFNGAGVFDFNKDEFLYKELVQGDVRDYVKKILEKFPSLACEVLVDKTVYVPAMNFVEQKHLELGDVKAVFAKLDEIPDGWIKVLFADIPENIDVLMDYIAENPFSDGHFTRSADVFYELIPKGVNKGTGLQKLVEKTGNSHRKIVVAGDYNNDIEMLEVADFAFAMGNAVDEVKKVADYIIGDNDTDGIAQIIEILIKNQG